MDAFKPLSVPIPMAVIATVWGPGELVPAVSLNEMADCESPILTGGGGATSNVTGKLSGTFAASFAESVTVA